MVCGLALFACFPACEQDSVKKEAPISAVRVVEASRQSAQLALVYNTTLRGSVEVRVFSQIPDRVRGLYVEQGDEVHKGQLLAVIQHKVLSSGLEAALAGQNSAQAQMEQLESERNRIRKLFEAHAVGEAQFDRINKQVQASEASVQGLQAMVNQAASQQGKAFVRAPISGVVGQRFVEQGDMAVPQIPLVTIVQMDELKADLMVPEFELPRIEAAMHKGYPVRVRSAGLLDSAGERLAVLAKIIRISPTIDLATRMAKVEIRFDNPDRKIRPGVLGEVEVVVEQNPRALLIPAYSVLSQGAVGASGQEIQHVVFTVVDGRAKRLPVRLGMQLSASRNGQTAMVEVVEGLEEGDQVVYRGHHLLEDGDTVVLAGTQASQGSQKEGGSPR